MSEFNIDAATPEQCQHRLNDYLSNEQWCRDLMAKEPVALDVWQRLSAKSHGVALAPSAPPSDPANPIEAARQLDVLMADKETDRTGRTWAQRVSQGEVEATQQFQELTGKIAAATPGDWATGNYVPDHHIDVHSGMPRRDLVAAGQSLLDRGHSPEAVKAIVDGQAPTREQYIAGKSFMDNIGNPGVVALLRTDSAARALFDEAAWATGAS
jgi:hypothetical protein